MLRRVFRRVLLDKTLSSRPFFSDRCMTTATHSSLSRGGVIYTTRYLFSVVGHPLHREPALYSVCVCTRVGGRGALKQSPGVPSTHPRRFLRVHPRSHRCFGHRALRSLPPCQRTRSPDSLVSAVPPSAAPGAEYHHPLQGGAHTRVRRELAKKHGTRSNSNSCHDGGRQRVLLGHHDRGSATALPPAVDGGCGGAGRQPHGELCPS